MPTQLAERQVGPPADQVEYSKAMLNILDDFAAERDVLGNTQRAVLNILDDFAEERSRFEATQRAVLNILDDFEVEKDKVERANQSLEERTVALSRSNAELETFAYVASHDLQEPLRMVTSYTQLLAKRYQGTIDAKADKFIAYIVDGTTRMQALIQDLLSYSRVGATDLNVTITDCEAVLALVMANLVALVRDTDARVTHDLLPLVLADRSQLAQLLQNLIANGIKFSGGRVPEVHLGAEDLGTEWCLMVRDHGIGIPAAHRQRIFQAFRRLHPQDYAGTGIGLAICEKIVARHGGRIWVESEPGSGSTFYVTLPRGEEMTT